MLLAFVGGLDESSTQYYYVNTAAKDRCRRLEINERYHRTVLNRRIQLYARVSGGSRRAQICR
jgi:hypothetical protein